MISNNFYACLTLLEHGSMRFKWDLENTHRKEFFNNILEPQKKLVPLQLAHSKIVIAADNEKDTENLHADGIITCNKDLVPIVTVADCMPIYMFDPITGCFGVLHSGWKGTGIVIEALKLAKQKYNAQTQDFQIIIGPHIKKCCYTVEKERADLFAKNIGNSCIEKITEKIFRLSLEEANMQILKNFGIPRNNITIIGSCTNCTNPYNPIYGSFRRETSHLENLPLEEKLTHFTPMAAFAYYGHPQEEMINSHIVIEKV